MILGIDPGKMTGMCLLVKGEVRWFEEVPFDDIHTVLKDTIPETDLVVVERYTISMRTVKMTRQYEALYTIGMTIYLTRIHKVEMTLQSPADAKAAFDDDHLRELGMYDQVVGGHARDALRHALLGERRLR